MTNSEVVQFIINKLNNDGSIAWKGNKELFELIFAPIAYGNELEDRQKMAKQPIYDIFKHIEEFDKIKFRKLTSNIVCGENENRYREEVITFIQKEITRLEITTDANIAKFVTAIPCKDGKEKNYRSHFANWKKESIYAAIHDWKSYC